MKGRTWKKENFKNYQGVQQIFEKVGPRYACTKVRLERRELRKFSGGLFFGLFLTNVELESNCNQSAHVSHTDLPPLLQALKLDLEKWGKMKIESGENGI